MRNIKFVVLVILLFIYILPVSAQTVESDDHCISLNDIVQLVGISTNEEFDSIKLLLHNKGYNYSNDTSTFVYTQSNISLVYHSSDCYYDLEHLYTPLIVIYKSSDGLSNIVEANIHKNTCSIAKLMQELTSKYIKTTEGKKIYSLQYSFGDKRSRCEIECDENAVLIKLTIKNIDEINGYISKIVDRKGKIIFEKMERAKKFSKALMFKEAYAVIDSAIGIYPPMDSSLYTLKKQVITSNVKNLYANLTEMINVNENISKGISICDEILSIDSNNDSVNQIRSILVGDTKKDFQPYSKYNPSAYNLTIASLENIINTEIKNSRTPLKHLLSLNFTFKTGIYNKTSGELSVEMFQLDGITPIDKANLLPYNEKYSRYVHSIANSSFLKPATKYGLIMNTEEKISCKIEYSCSEKIVKVVKGKMITSASNLLPSIDSVNKKYLRNISAKTSKDTLPYKVIYTVTQWDKTCNDEASTDYRITDIKTSAKTSWVPSLFVPGLGTKMQGYHYSAFTRAFPFALFMGLAITSFSWENNGGLSVPRTRWGSGNSRFWENKNFGYIAGFTCLSVATTIYINDLVESILASKRNIKRTQRIRDAFEKNGNCIDLQTQDIKLKSQ